LHDLDAGARELLGDLVVAYAGLEPDRLRLRRENIFEVRRDVLGAPEDVDHVHGAGHVRQFAVDLLPEYLGHLRVVDRHGDDFKPRRGEVLRDVEGGLVRLPLGLDAEHRHAMRLRQQLAKPLVRPDQILAPVAPARRLPRVAAVQLFFGSQLILLRPAVVQEGYARGRNRTRARRRPSPFPHILLPPLFRRKVAARTVPDSPRRPSVEGHA
jgi:hypothetical protein